MNMEILNKQIRLDMYYLILLGNILSGIALYVWYLNETDAKTINLISGLFTGIAIAILQLMYTWYDHKKVKALESIGVRKVLPYRDDELFYRDLITRSNRSIDILGSTAYRFLDDFAGEDRSDKQALITALIRKVKVRILLPNKDQLFNNDDKHKSDMSNARLLKLSKTYKDHLEFKYYDHMPTHSLVVIDNDCLAGPIFPHVSSKDSPAIYTDTNSVFVKSYLAYFDHEWANAK